jgi:hypothetical protein
MPRVTATANVALKDYFNTSLSFNEDKSLLEKNKKYKMTITNNQLRQEVQMNIIKRQRKEINRIMHRKISRIFKTKTKQIYQLNPK